MIFSDPFARPDSPGEGPGRGRARLACRVVVLMTAAAMLLGSRYAPSETEPFTFLGVAVVLVSAVLSYVL